MKIQNSNILYKIKNGLEYNNITKHTLTKVLIFDISTEDKVLSDKDIIDIYELTRNNVLSQQDIADKCNISRSMVAAIKSGRLHSNITGKKYIKR